MCDFDDIPLGLATTGVLTHCSFLHHTTSYQELEHGIPLMCVGLLPSKKPANRCLISKTPDFSKTPVYNHKVISRPRLRMG